jgi:AcrR family transcriptional regulator
LLVTEVNEALPGGSSLLRNEPVQARSSARLTGLLDAAAAIIDEIGFERLTTAMVAERAGASIGTVYRYFPDRIAVVEALAARCIQRLIDRIDTAVAEGELADWHDAVQVAIDVDASMYRSEPGFRAIRFSDVENADKVPTGALAPDDERRSLASAFTSLLVKRFGLEKTPEFEFAIEVATELGTALVARAFSRDRAGDSRFLAECHSIVKGYLAGVVVSQP